MKRIVSAALLVTVFCVVSALYYMDNETETWIEYGNKETDPPFPGYLDTVNLLHDCVSDKFPHYGEKQSKSNDHIYVIREKNGSLSSLEVSKHIFEFRTGKTIQETGYDGKDDDSDEKEPSLLYANFFGQ